MQQLSFVIYIVCLSVRTTKLLKHVHTFVPIHIRWKRELRDRQTLTFVFSSEQNNRNCKHDLFTGRVLAFMVFPLL